MFCSIKPFFLLSTGNYGKVVEVAKSKKSGSKEELSRSRDDLRRNRDDLRRSREDLSRSRDDVSVGMEDLSDDGQPLLGSEDELERGQLLDPGPLDRSVSKPRKPQPTELDR